LDLGEAGLAPLSSGVADEDLVTGGAAVEQLLGILAGEEGAALWLGDSHLAVGAALLRPRLAPGEGTDREPYASADDESDKDQRPQAPCEKLQESSPDQRVARYLPFMSFLNSGRSRIGLKPFSLRIRS
jgi:hypothetical protein